MISATFRKKTFTQTFYLPFENQYTESCFTEIPWIRLDGFVQHFGLWQNTNNVFLGLRCTLCQVHLIDNGPAVAQVEQNQWLIPVLLQCPWARLWTSNCWMIVKCFMNARILRLEIWFQFNFKSNDPIKNLLWFCSPLHHLCSLCLLYCNHGNASGPNVFVLK